MNYLPFIKFIKIFLLSFLVACAAKETAPSKASEIIPATNPVVITTPIPTPTPVPTPPPIVEILNLDDDFEQKVRPLWNTSFKEDFTDSKAVDVYVYTNRNTKLKVFGCTDQHFGIDDGKVMHNGVCKINVPKNHTTGEIKVAKSLRQSSHDFYKVLNARSLAQEAIFEAIKKSNRTPLVFVHGFNVRFGEAVMRAAQIAYDLKYQGPVILFSWPSGAGDGFFDENLLARVYDYNGASAQASVAAFKHFLLEFQNQGMKMNLVVHSMGHQVVFPALKALGVSGNKKIVNELILNAPDYEAGEFIRLTEIIKNVSRRITLYCSFNDKAMYASKSVHKNDRLGACTYSEDVDSINVSLVDGDTLALGHGYYSSRAILSDVFQVLLGLAPEHRLFIKKSEPNSTEKYFLRP